MTVDKYTEMLTIEARDVLVGSMRKEFLKAIKNVSNEQYVEMLRLHLVDIESALTFNS